MPAIDQSHKKICMDCSQSTLEGKGYTMVDTGSGYLSVVKIADAIQMNLPLMEKSDIPQMTHPYLYLAFCNG